MNTDKLKTYSLADIMNSSASKMSQWVRLEDVPQIQRDALLEAARICKEPISGLDCDCDGCVAHLNDANAITTAANKILE